MIWVDWVLLVVVAVSGFVGLFRGLVKEALSLLVWVLAIWVAWKFSPLIAPQFSGVIGDSVLRLWGARIATLISVLIIGGLGTWLISYLLDRTGLTGTDRLLGGLFGVARGSVLAALVVIGLQFTGFDAAPWWQESKLIPYAAPIADKLRVVAAEGIDMLDDVVDQE